MDSALLQPAFSGRLHPSGMTTHPKNPWGRTSRVVRLVLLAGTVTALAAPVGLASAVRASEPVRSGTIVSGTGPTGTSPGWGMDGCVGAPNCRSWIVSGCDARLAGQEPAPMAAIVDVGDLADGATPRSLDVKGGVGINWGGFFVQFWTDSKMASPLGEHCEEIAGTRRTSWRHCGRLGNHCVFAIPADARWMTITSTPDNTHINWKLT